MANKPKKRPKHTKFVLPGEGKLDLPADKQPDAKDRLGRTAAANHAGEKTTGAAAGKAQAPLFDAQTAEIEEMGKEVVLNLGTISSTGTIETGASAQPSKAKEPAKGLPQELPDNAIMLPVQTPRKVAARKKRNKRRLRRVGLLSVILFVLFLYFSGYYLNIIMGVSSGYESIRIRLTPGDGYPADFALNGFKKSEEMGKNGFAALGDKDAVLFSSSGRELRRIQHGYATPGLTAGDTRVCVYNRGGTDYAIHGRDDLIAARKTKDEILFAQLSPGGSLAVVSGSRHQAMLEVYSPVYLEDEPEMSWPILDDKPIMAAFHSDNRTLALGCLSVKGGALGSTIYFLRSDSKQRESVEARDARLLRIEYANGKLIALFDKYAVLYSTVGTEIARYDYNNRNLLTADIQNGKIALIFGSESREKLELVRLDASFREELSVLNDSAPNPQVLLAGTEVYLLSGQEITAYSNEGEQIGTTPLTVKVYGLVRAPEPLLLTTTQAEPLDQLLGISTSTKPATGSSTQLSEGEDSSGGESAAVSEVSSQPAGEEVSSAGEEELSSTNEEKPTTQVFSPPKR